MASTASRWQTVWGLAVALLLDIVLLVGSQLALGWMTPGKPFQRTAAMLAGVVALTHAGILFLSAQTAPIDQAGRDAARALALSPPLVLVVIVPLMWDGVLATASLSQLLLAFGPVLAAVWGVALSLAPLCVRANQALAGPTQGLPREGSRGSRQTWSILFACAVGAASTLSLGLIIASVAELGGRELWPAIALLVFTGLFAWAGGSFARHAGDEIVSLARHLDRVDDQNIGTRTRPIVITRLDAFGLLQADIERLRRGLSEEHRLYKETLTLTQEAAIAKAEFLAAVSHELRTPLNSICGFSQLLLEGLDTRLAETQREDIRLIRTSGMHLLALINDILDISIIESGELHLNFHPEVVAEIIDEVVRQHRPLVREAGLDLRHEVAGDIPHVVCDRRRICQILNNLLSNATKFTEQGSITVSASYDLIAERVLIRVIDSGIGIAAEDHEKIFEEYQQVGNLAQRKKGTGLGLAIARSIAEHHGGSLSVVSTPNRGSTFTLALPIDPPRKPTSIDMTAEVVRASVRRSAPPTQPEVLP